jgi:hypothetical protein
MNIVLTMLTIIAWSAIIFDLLVWAVTLNSPYRRLARINWLDYVAFIGITFLIAKAVNS